MQPTEIKNLDLKITEPEEKELSPKPQEKMPLKIKVANLQCEPRLNTEVPSESICKVENFEGLHSTLNIKEEHPTFDESNQQTNNSSILQQNYIVASSGQPAVANYYVMPQPPAASAVQQPGYIQATAYAAPVGHQVCYFFFKFSRMKCFEIFKKSFCPVMFLIAFFPTANHAIRHRSSLLLSK